jgi:glyoxylase-like metal-dependent hydrolase (beta-lactamase superfamily II)
MEGSGIIHVFYLLSRHNPGLSFGPEYISGATSNLFPHRCPFVNRYSFITRVPDKPGSLHKAAEIVARHNANINRIQFDRRIDPFTVFFELSSDNDEYLLILKDLAKIGYLQTSLKPLSFLKIYVYMPHEPGALFEFLNYTTSCRASIAFIDFDDKGLHPDRLTVSVNLDDPSVAERLLGELRSRYRIEVLEYDNSGEHLDDTVFYLRFAQSIRELTGETSDEILLPLMGDINHIVQELMSLGQSPKDVFESILKTGNDLRNTSGEGFYADIQKIRVTGEVDLFCFQPPCGGSIYVFSSPEEQVMIDTGYGIYHERVMEMLGSHGLCNTGHLSRIIVTHADADHCGAAGFFQVPVSMHPGTQKIIEKANRAYGSGREDSVLEEVYTTLIGLFSRFTPPKTIELVPPPTGDMMGIFPQLKKINICGLTFSLLEGLGGHQHGQIYLLCEEEKLLFTADTIINFDYLTKDRADYSSLAALLVDSVNVDSSIARVERKGIFDLVKAIERSENEKQKPFLICGGHGPVSSIVDGKLIPFGHINHYPASRQAP